MASVSPNLEASGDDELNRLLFRECALESPNPDESGDDELNRLSDNLQSVSFSTSESELWTQRLQIGQYAGWHVAKIKLICKNADCSSVNVHWNRESGDTGEFIEEWPCRTKERKVTGVREGNEVVLLEHWEIWSMTLVRISPNTHVELEWKLRARVPLLEVGRRVRRRTTDT